MAEIAPNGLLDEHAPRHEQHGGPATYEPTSEERKAIKLAERLFERAKKFRAQYDDRWIDYYRMFRGKQWKENRPSYRHSEVINFIFRTIQSTVPIQADPKPRFDFMPEEPSDQELAEILSHVAESDWTRNNWSEQLLEVIYDANFYGTGLSEMCFNPEAKAGLGEIEYKSADPFYCFPDPDARDVNKGGTYFVHAEPTDIRRVKRRYPHVAEFVKPDIQDLMKGSKTDFAPMKYRSPVDNRVTVEGSPTMDLLDKEKVLVVTAYIRAEGCSDEFEEIENKTVDPESGLEQTSYVKQAKYPNGRKIVVANGVLCEDGPLPYDDGEIPYQRYQNYVLPREFWGISEVEQVEGPQKIFNKVVNFSLDVLTLMGNPIWLVHGQSGIDTDNLTNRPGLVVEWDGDPSTRPSREEGVGLQPFVFQLIDRLAEWFDSIAGSQDVTRGVQPTGVTAASAISNLQEAAQTRLRLKSRILDTYLQTLGQHYASRVFQFRTAPQIYRVTNQEGVSRYFKMHVEEYEKTEPAVEMDELGQEREVQVPTGERGRRAIVQPYREDGSIDIDNVRTYEMRGRFDVRVSTGSSLPFAKAEKEQRLFNLFDRGIIDAEEVLKGLDYPNYQAVVERKAQADAMAAQQAAAAKGAPAPAA